ncbi:methyl-accepting chemotaxis protein [Marinomonas fungiae]|uniref:Methyl-accepting chemotaxis protein n=1 Tax=Marinomonas fungiae TaxID=1137284 RepID=A0A0K6IMT2_9GAMM|nr:methyl-accepting chemotaxis protein [Marinomonas fungiae]CUB04430.1 Methyl-accepting chemotaxis protein [Marinomonas fungiae]
MGIRTIKGKLIASFMTLLILLSVITGVAITRLHNLTASLEQIVERNAQLVESSTELTNLAEGLASRLLLLFVLDERDQRVAIYKEIDAKNAAMDARIEGMQNLTDSTGDTTKLAQLIDQKTRYQSALQATVEALEFGELDDAKKQMSGDTRVQLEDFIKLAQAYADTQRLAMSEQQQDVLESSDQAIIMMLSIGLLALIAGLIMALLITRSVVHPLQSVGAILDQVAEGDVSKPVLLNTSGELAHLAHSTEKMRSSLVNLLKDINLSVHTVSDSVNAIGTTVTDVRTGAQSQEKMATSIDHSITQLSNVSQRIASHLTSAKDQADSAHQLAKQGVVVINAASTDIRNVANFMADSATSVADLEQSAAKVTEFVDQIREVADQTNLLALNASIEAARAGETGRGFAVVADEVRNLANNTASVTESIDHVITQISQLATQVASELEQGRAKVHHGMEQIEQVVTPLSQLEEDSAQALHSLNDLTQLAAQQSQDASNIRQQVQMIVDVIRHNTLTSEQLESLTNTLQAAVMRSKSATSTFRLPS